MSLQILKQMLFLRTAATQIPAHHPTVMGTVDKSRAMMIPTLHLENGSDRVKNKLSNIKLSVIKYSLWKRQWMEAAQDKNYRKKQGHFSDISPTIPFGYGGGRVSAGISHCQCINKATLIYSSWEFVLQRVHPCAMPWIDVLAFSPWRLWFQTYLKPSENKRAGL